MNDLSKILYKVAKDDIDELSPQERIDNWRDKDGVPLKEWIERKEKQNAEVVEKIRNRSQEDRMAWKAKRAEKKSQAMDIYPEVPPSPEMIASWGEPRPDHGFLRETANAGLGLLGVDNQARRQLWDNVGMVTDAATSSPEKIKERVDNYLAETVEKSTAKAKADVVSELNARFAKYAPQLKMMGGGLAALLGVYLLSRLFQNRGGGGGGSNINVYATAPAQNAPARRWNSGSLFRG